MRYPLPRGALSNVDDPFAMNRFAHQLRPPQSGRDVRKVGDDTVQNLPSYLCDLESGYCADRMVHLVQNEEIEVAQVARNRVVDDLPATIFE